MFFRPMSFLLYSVVCSACLAAEPVSARRYEIDDLYHADGFASPAISPDGKRAAWIHNWIDQATKDPRNSLWLVSETPDTARPAEQGEPDARGPMFSPDGKWVLFLSTRPRPDGWRQTLPTPVYSEPALDLWLIPAAGGRAIPLAGPDKPYGRVFADGFYGNIVFSPDGTRLVFVADDGQDSRTPEEIEAGVEVVRPDQGEGYTGLRPAQIWIAHLATEPAAYAAPRIDRLTHDDFWYGDPQWSPDGTTIVVHANRTADQESVRYSINKNYDLWALHCETAIDPASSPRQLTFGPGPEFSPRFSPDGKQLACLTTPRQGPHIDVFNLALVNLHGTPVMHVVYDHRAPGVDYRTHPSPMFPLPSDCWRSGQELVYSAHPGLTPKTMLANLSTGELNEFVATDANPQRAAEARLRPRSSSALPPRLSASSQAVRWKSNDGQEIDGVLVTPHPDIATPPFKVIVNPHGGPHYRASLGVGFDDQVFAAQGYAIFKPNFRGSTGYSLEFLDADRGDFGGGDMRDILSGVEHLIREGLIDKNRQFVYGVSYGGYMTSWLVGQTQQFKAAAAQNAVTDLAMMWGLSDLQSWPEWEFGGRPWEVPEKLREHSPITYVGQVKTPTLILHSRDDRRCPVAMGKAFHQSLRSAGVPTEMVIYPEENHGIRQPRHRADVLRRILAWFEKYDPGATRE